MSEFLSTNPNDCLFKKKKNVLPNVLCALKTTETVALTVSCPSSLSLYDFGSFSEKTWFTDEPENTHLRTIQIKPVNTLAVNQVSQYKSTSSLIPPIREAEDECWVATPERFGLPEDSSCHTREFLLTWGHKSSIEVRREYHTAFLIDSAAIAYCTSRFRIIHEDNHSQMLVCAANL